LQSRQTLIKHIPVNGKRVAESQKEYEDIAGGFKKLIGSSTHLADIGKSGVP
jgi:hypothetical protein